MPAPYTPDLDYRWQALIVTERSPLSLEETALIAMGFFYIKRESDVAEWESEDWRIKRAHKFYAEPLAMFKLTLAQKVLLMYNNTGIRRSCGSRHNNITWVRRTCSSLITTISRG